jgi:hypothetical protein
MKKSLFVAILIVFGGLGLLFRSSVQTTEAQDDKGRVPPEVIVLGQDAKLGKVTFNHANHFGKDFNVDGSGPIECIKCHHVEQPASEIAKDSIHKTVYPADRTVKLTLESLKDPKTPLVTSCRSCHIRSGTEPTLLNEIPKIEDEKTGKMITLTNQYAFHRTCAACHDQVTKARPDVKPPGTMKCTSCHKRG